MVVAPVLPFPIVPVCERSWSKDLVPGHSRGKWSDMHGSHSRHRLGVRPSLLRREAEGPTPVEGTSSLRVSIATVADLRGGVSLQFGYCVLP
jgi:hypothetical protein